MPAAGYYALRVLGVVANVLQGIIFIECIISWIPPVRHSRVGYIFRVLSEPILAPFRFLLGKTPLRSLPVDFSPIIAFFAIDLCYRLIANILIQIFYRAL